MKTVNGRLPTDVDLRKSWYASATTQDRYLGNHVKTFDVPFQLLAIANRMDMASFQGTQGSEQWTGAEIHFTYGLTPVEGADTDPITMIVEFALPPLDDGKFQHLARTWGSLSTSFSTTSLKGALQESGLALEDPAPALSRRVRIRMNRFLGENWLLTEMLLDPSTAIDNPSYCAFAKAGLDDQIQQMPGPPDPGKYLVFWKQVETFVTAPASNPYPALSGLTQDSPLEYGDPPFVVTTSPKSLCVTTLQARNAIAMQQCAFCHTSETGTSFTHISNRQPNAPLRISGFLTGSDPSSSSPPNLHPALSDLYYGDQGNVWPVSAMSYTTYQGDSCADPVTVPVPARKFHDIARRTLFLAFVIAGEVHNGRSPRNPFGTLNTE